MSGKVLSGVIKSMCGLFIGSSQTYPKNRKLASGMTRTNTLRSLLCGTELEILHEGLRAALPAEMCDLG